MFLYEQLAANGGSASPETFGNIVAAKAIFDFITNDSISAVTYGSAGTGYIVGETFDILMTGVASPEPVTIFVARGVVVAESGGVPSEVKVISGGSYIGLALLNSPFDTPLTGLSTANSSAGGDNGLLVDVVPEQSHWTEDRGNGAESPIASTDFSDFRTQFEWICTSNKPTNPATIGMETIGGGNAYVNLLTATGFDKTQAFFSQPGASPNSANLLMPSNDPEIYVSSTERRVNIIIRDGAFMHYGIIGFFIPYTDTEANYPFPGIIAGTTSGALPFNTNWGDLSSAPATVAAGIVNPMTVQTGTAVNGPYWFRDNLSPGWLSISKATSEVVNMRAQIWPAQHSPTQYDFTDASVVDGFSTDPGGVSGFISAGILREVVSASSSWFGSDSGGADGIQGIGPLGLGSRLSFVVQPHIVANQTGDVQIIGILDGFEAVHGRGLTAFQEIVQASGKRYVVFNDTNGSALYRWVAMEII
ncbi:MAG: hypothetical protein E4G91_00385 [Candidatus Zixiibacteriota bacterium]|nr:MAG: hypothetical protein E4G91_00385 [candidate division Zixibacteria bacterium]